ncbi:MAG: helix-turn-helix transcriptional regulator [Clostridia bacterium]|nr:helix-turn-helix transcriptional regulator [Clostridia bacterium]
MLNQEEIHCGVYDSLISQKGKKFSPMRRAARYELELYHTDSGISYIDGKAFPVRRGMLVCAKPGQQRYSRLPIRSSFIWITTDSDVAWILDSLPVCSYVEDEETVEELLQLFARLHSGTAGPTWSAQQAVECNRRLLGILQIYLRQCREDEKPHLASQTIREAYRYMDKHYCESCTLSEIAQAVHLSANHLHKIFAESEGCTPYEYVTEKRIKKAETLILMGEHSLAQVALESGFCSQSHLTAAFKKSKGQTPAQYRKQLFRPT